MSENRENRIKRMKMRSMRRGIREMDLILSTFADRNLAGMDDAALDGFDALLEENDQDLYAWITKRAEPPLEHVSLIDRISQVFQKSG